MKIPEMQRNIADVRNQRLEDFVMQIFPSAGALHIHECVEFAESRPLGRERENVKHVSVVSHSPQLKRGYSS